MGVSPLTPEGKTKAKIKRVLDRYGDELWRYMPVPGGYGKQALDYVCCYRGYFFTIEAKRKGGRPTEKQLGTMDDVRAAGGTVFVIDDDTSELEAWLSTILST